MIEAVFFDYDGVLTADKTGSLTTCRYLSRCTGIELPRLMQAFRIHNHELTLGRRSHADVWPHICARLGQDVPLGLLVEAFESTPVNAPMFALARQLKSCGCDVGIITDNKSDRMAHLRKLQRLEEIFDPIVVSAEVGCTKQEQAIFRLALARRGTPPDRALFIDNTEANLVAARALGLYTIFFDDEVNDVAALREQLRSHWSLPVGMNP